ncbi:unnamed protein product [Heligmosomoides polygyrus]|uniref:LRRCT domain-containing protein n=1 Tax=Heligmosomoides polygyrus TaxID=6339 RepID=A0A3P7YN10_HELPZ|nr:unnamed protein product [Heligmosomoides polygyrus]
MPKGKFLRLYERTFSHQTKLFWLDLSKKQLASFEDGTFDAKIANILLDGNPLFCDDEFDWFVWCLVTNRVRTFLPYQSEITCAGPKKYVGVSLKDLMIRKANDTLTEGMKTLGFNEQSQWSLTSALIPGLRGAPTGQMDGGAALEQAAAGLPILNPISQVVVLVVLLGMCHGMMLPVVFAALLFKEIRVSQEKPHLLTIMERKTRVGHQARHA